jgi:Glyoxalase-like domain
VEIDHVLIAVSDLETAARRLARAHGLTTYEGGRHPGWGTANWIAPLRSAYLELIAIADEQEARESVLGHWVGAAEDGALVGWAVRPRDLGSTATRLGIEVTEGSRTLPSGERTTWRTAGVEEASRRRWLPFFIERPGSTRFPGAAGNPVAEISRLEIEGDPEELARWLDNESLPLDVRPGDAGVTMVVLNGPDGEIVVERPAR